MAHFEIIMPKMGESIEEATITKWFIKPGDKVKEDDILLEIATDKVDSEIPSPVEGIVKKLLYQQDEIVPVGAVIAIIDLDVTATELDIETKPAAVVTVSTAATVSEQSENKDGFQKSMSKSKQAGRFYSPLVRSIAKKENISLQELDKIAGSGHDGRIQKNDILSYIENRKSGKITEKKISGTYQAMEIQSTDQLSAASKQVAGPSLSAGDEIVQMDRMRKIIAEHMIRSVQTSAHVTNVIEVDVTDVVNWRNRIKDSFEKKEGQKITFLPVFMDAIIKGLKDFPMINSSVDGDKIIIKKRINLGIAVALPNFNLIVPVIKNADNLNLAGITKELNRLANAARNNKLKPDEIQDGTFTITNFGSFKNLIGTPIINQPQVAILAIGSIEKKPAVLETSKGDVIAIRHKMFLSLTYDHRIIDGSLGGAFLRRVGDYIESFDSNSSL
jgi:2-oxoglutarate dehydrogenase E2 component (dihydrolipoamide succinyltransferase)